MIHKKHIINLIVVLECMLLVAMPINAKIIDSKSIYTEDISQKTNDAIDKIHEHYSDITELVTIGQSAKEQTDIKAIRLGKGEKYILINGAHHGRESLTAILTLDQLQYLAEAYSQNKTIDGYDVRSLLNTVSIWFVPMTNPDGADIAMSTSPSWKANGNGVDLNKNYPTLYAQNKSAKQPGPIGYSGPYPFSEPETQALYEMCEKYNFESAIAYHSAGEVIYWWYYQTDKVYDDSLYLAKGLSKTTGYALMPISESKGGLGFTDWFIQVYNRPGFTLEIGKTVNGKPLKWQEYGVIWEKNKNIPLQLTQEIIKMKTSQTDILVEGQSIKGQKVFDTTMVPVKDFANIFNLSYSYDSVDKSITLKDLEKRITFWVGEKEIVHNGEVIQLPVPAYISNGTSYIPLDPVLEIFFGLKEPDIPFEETEIPIEEQIDESLEEDNFLEDDSFLEEMNLSF